MQSKVFELLDFPKFASPSLSLIQASPTASSLVDRLQEKSFMTYGQIWPRLIDIVRFGASEAYLQSNFSSYTAEWKNKAIRGAVRELDGLIGGRGVWYKVGLRPRVVAGFVFKNSIRGVWFYEGRSYAVLINARKSQRLSASDVLFLARGIYELYCIDDPNDPIPMIIDLSVKTGEVERSPATYILPVADAMPLVMFEEILRVFLEAMAIAGVASPTRSDAHIVDLLRGRNF